MNVTKSKRGRINVHVTAYAQEIIEHAAKLTATTTRQFVAQAALREAERVIRESQAVELSVRDMSRYLSALESPPALNERLAAALLRNLKVMENSSESRFRKNETRIGWKPRPKAV